MGKLLPHYPVPIKNDDASKMALNENLLWLATQLTQRRMTVVKKTASYTATFSDELILVDTTGGNVTITLPSSTRISGKVYRIKRLTGGVNTLTVQGSGGATIDGAASISLPTQWDARNLVTDGTGWFIL